MTDVNEPAIVSDRAAVRAAEETAAPQSPAVVFWTQMRKSPLAIAGGVVLALFYLLAMFAPFVAPYSEEEMDRAKYFHPPQPLHWVRADGSFSVRPYVRDMRLVDVGSFEYAEEPSSERPVRFSYEGFPTTCSAFCPPTFTCSAWIHRGACSCSAAIRSAATCCRGCCRLEDLVDGRAGRHRDLLHSGPAAGRHRRIFRRLRRYGDHARDRAAPQHPVAVSHHRASRRVPDGFAEPPGVSGHRRDTGVHRLGGAGARHPRPRAVDAQERLRHGR